MWPSSVLNIFFYFKIFFFVTGQKIEEGLLLLILVIHSCYIAIRKHKGQSVSNPMHALWVVITAKELGISQGFPPGGQYTSGPYTVIVQ
jgi:hypothetical protein